MFRICSNGSIYAIENVFDISSTPMATGREIISVKKWNDIRSFHRVHLMGGNVYSDLDFTCIVDEFGKFKAGNSVTYGNCEARKVLGRKYEVRKSGKLVEIMTFYDFIKKYKGQKGYGLFTRWLNGNTSLHVMSDDFSDDYFEQFANLD